MVIDINLRWRLRTDPMNWIIEEKVGTRKKRRGQGTEARWKPRAYFQDYWKTLGFIIQWEIRSMKGAYPPSALEPLSLGLAQIEDLISAFGKSTESAFRDVPSVAKARSPQKMHLRTPANENTLAPKKKRRG